MFLVIKGLKEACSIFVKDRIIVLFSLIPVFLGMILYYFLGYWLYSDVLDWGKKWIESSITGGPWSTVLYYILATFLTVALFFMVSWTFVLFVTLIASPFNDLISSRVEKIVGGQSPDSVSQSFKLMMANIFRTLLNEIKKIAFVFTLTIAGILVSFVPILAPLTIIISAMLLAITFLDYSWCRHNLSLKKCISDLSGGIFPYIISGIIFLFIMAIPVVNLFGLPFAVVYFTVIFTRKNIQRSLS